MRETWVVGAASNRYGRMDESAREAATRVAAQAIEVSGLSPKQISHTFVANCFGVADHQAHVGPLINNGLGIPEVPSVTLESACSSSSAALHEAYVHVAGGFADAALVVGVERLLHLGTLAATSYFAIAADYPYETKNGATFPGLYATLANAYLREYPNPPEMLGAIALKNHANAVHNPHAQFRKAISMETYLGSPMIASPLRLYDCCPFSDGAAAVVVAAKEAVPHPAAEPLVVRASVRAGAVTDMQDRPDLLGLPSTRAAAEKAFRQAKLTPSQIDFLEVHDCFTIAEALAIEDLGFAPKGGGIRLAHEGVTAHDGKLPVNPSGGLKAKGHPVGATGAGQVVEIFEQVNGTADGRAVPKTGTALAHNVGATGGSCSVHIFSRR